MRRRNKMGEKREKNKSTVAWSLPATKHKTQQPAKTYLFSLLSLFLSLYIVSCEGCGRFDVVEGATGRGERSGRHRRRQRVWFLFFGVVGCRAFFYIQYIHSWITCNRWNFLLVSVYLVVVYVTILVCKNTKDFFTADTPQKMVYRNNPLRRSGYMIWILVALNEWILNGQRAEI